MGIGVAVRAAELTGGMLGQTVSVCRSGRRGLVVNPWLRRGELVEVVHHLDRCERASAASRVVLTVAVGESRAEVTFVVRPDDVIRLYR